MNLKINRVEDSELTKMLAGVIGACEANSFEHLCLWEEHHRRNHEIWLEAREGINLTIGWDVNRPICISIQVDSVCGHKILFWHTTSQLVDYYLISKWLNDYLPDLPHVDAMNFHNVFPAKELRNANDP